MEDGEWTVDRTLADDVDAAARTWRQGDVFRDAAIVRYADADRPLTVAAARGGSGLIAIREPLSLAVVVSQTCEIVRPCDERPMIHLAEVVELTGQTCDEAKRGWRPRYVSVPWAGENRFADLEIQGVVEKSILLDADLIASCPDAANRLSFATGLGRHRSRFAFPDDLATALRPLVERLRQKARKPTPQGRRIDEIREIRARAAPDWDADRVSVELLFLISPESLPPQVPVAEPSVELLEEVDGLDAQRLAELLDAADIDAVRRNAIWQRLVDEWSRRANPVGCICEITAVAVPLNEFTRADELITPELDLDYLSQ